MGWIISEVEDPQENKIYFCAIKRSPTWWIIALGGILLETFGIYLTLNSGYSHTLNLMVIALFTFLFGIIIVFLVRFSYDDVEVDTEKYDTRFDCEIRCKELNNG